MKNILKIYDAQRIAIKADGTKLPVLDAQCSFVVYPNEQDIREGIPNDHANCMYCLACRRMYGSELVWITRTLAYVELPDNKGKLHLYRFLLTDPAKVKLKDFDGWKHIPPHAVIFAQPKGARTLAAQARAQAEWAAKQAANISSKSKKKKAHVVGTQKRGHTLHPLDATSLRDPATGMFQFKTLR